MPRRKTLLAPKGRIILGDMLLSPKCGVILCDVPPLGPDMEAIKRAIRACGATRRLPRTKKNTLRFDLGEAVVFAKIGVRPWLSGRRVKPDAWNLDILVRGAFDAWRRAGLSPTVRDDATGKSEFLLFAEDLAKRLEMHGARGSLFHNALRARKMVVFRSAPPPRPAPLPRPVMHDGNALRRSSDPRARPTILYLFT
jgi:hypothetical protein